MKKVLLGLGLAVALVTVVPACSSDDTGTSSGASGTSGTSGSTTPADATVNVVSNRFDPQTVTIKVGQTVQWKWGGGTHDVISGKGCAPDNKFTSGAPQSGGTFERKFAEAGTFDYYCSPHCASANMVGQVVVTP